jgi:Alpha galactosidase A/Alpha galactosidase C-terminal beta sandwich domain
VIGLCLILLSAAPAGAMLAPTPYMGWNTYYGVGGRFDEQTITSVADAMVSDGLARAGYRIVWLDFGWATGARDSQGNLIVDPAQWPHGLGWLTAYLHARGLLAGIYTDAGPSGCDGGGVGSLGHYQQDADAFAAWGFDAVKVDFCGAAQAGLTPQAQYTQFAAALAANSSHRPMLVNVDNFLEPGQLDGTNPSFTNSAYANYQWAPQIAQSWRTDTDIGGRQGNGIQFVNVLRNLDADAAHPEAAGPGHWNDPDYLAPELGVTPAEAQAQLSMWAIVAAPLILGSDPRTLSPESLAMLENPQVIAVDQDPLGVQGSPIAREGQGQVWVKPLADRGRAVALLNRGTDPVQLTTSASAVGLPLADTYQVEDLWAGTTTLTFGPITAQVAADSAQLYRVSALPAVAAVVGHGGQMYVHAPGLQNDWQNLGGHLLAPPAVAAAATRMAGGFHEPLFIAVNADHNLYVRTLRGQWRKLASAYCLDSPAATVVGLTLDVACEGADHGLWYGSTRLPLRGLPHLKALHSLGGKLSAGPAMARVKGTLTFFVSGIDHRLYTRTLLRRYIRFKLPCYGHPSADVAPGGATTYAACEDKGGSLRVMSTSGRHWSAKTRYGGKFTGGPGIAATSAGIVLWATAHDGSAMATSTPSGWSDSGIGVVRPGVTADGIG